MRGKITIAIWKRQQNDSKRWKDKWKYFDLLSMYSITHPAWKKSRYKVISERRGFQTMIITKDETTFIKYVNMNYGTGDYCIKTWAKGKERGIRIFWDGLITDDKKFIRRKNTGYLKETASLFERDSFSINSDSKIGKYFRTKIPGVWHSF